ncbi:hypothetical protein P167DRAFT_178720 [Morchella conica CCBAS932]|uniref:Uncharacterized protein n=1 Tax=Morchella conica CCBAS932 TaxID=1392247 RepID=A0A3N4K783_9PEZI|nr:hypothetical protein P167DRAFT_178720 [Morchella conica CCBAS932]
MTLASEILAVLSHTTQTLGRVSSADTHAHLPAEHCRLALLGLVATAEAAARLAETEKFKAEAMMARSDKLRIDAETERLNAETERVKAEAIIEKMRIDAETVRLNAETERLKAEALMARSERMKIDAETERLKWEVEVEKEKAGPREVVWWDGSGTVR